MRVTRACLPSGAMSYERIISGLPNFVIAPVATSTRPIWPVACHFSSWKSYGVFIRLGNVRSRLRSPSSDTRICGPVGAAGGSGRGVRPSGAKIAEICLPPLTNSKLVTNVSSSGVFVICRGLLVATSVIHTCVASSPSVM